MQCNSKMNAKENKIAKIKKLYLWDLELLDKLVKMKENEIEKVQKIHKSKEKKWMSKKSEYKKRISVLQDMICRI